MNISIWDRLRLSIPFIRHRISKNTISCQKQEYELIDMVNRSFSYVWAPNIVRLYNNGKIDVDAISSPKYYRYILLHMFGKKVKEITEQIRIEKATLKSFPDVSVWLLKIPSCHEIGHNDIVAFVVLPEGKAYFYCWEWSVGGSHMIGTFENKNHLNFGMCDSKVEFVKRIVELSME